MALDQEKLQDAVRMLLEQENLEFVERMRICVDADPHYLYFYEASTSAEVRRILWAGGRGIYVSESADALLILREAMRRIPGISAA